MICCASRKAGVFPHVPVDLLIPAGLGEGEQGMDRWVEMWQWRQGVGGSGPGEGWDQSVRCVSYPVPVPRLDPPTWINWDIPSI